jgi:hypothetical protein
MPDNNMLIMLGLGAAALWFMNRGGSQEDQVDQLAGAAMMASGEGTSPDAPFQAYSAPANPTFFFNRGGQMAQVPGTNVPMGASSDEDIGQYPGGGNRKELEFQVAPSTPPPGTSDISPTTPQFAGTAAGTVTASSVWDQQAVIASANFMPLLAIQDTGGGGVKPLFANTDISNLSSKEQFRALNVDTGFAFTTTADVLGEYVQGFTGTPAAPPTNNILVSQTVPSAPAWTTGTASHTGGAGTGFGIDLFGEW